MQICIAGWYYHKDCLIPLSTYSNAHIIAHRPGDHLNISVTVIENVGLEFHCYDYFIKNVWDKTSDVLFCHDDIIINDVSVLDDLQELKNDITMVWHDENHRKRNLAHGRMFKCSANYLHEIKGFWWDKNNTGCLDASKGCNEGIGHFYQSYKDRISHFYTNKLRMGFRGKV